MRNRDIYAGSYENGALVFHTLSEFGPKDLDELRVVVSIAYSTVSKLSELSEEETSALHTFVRRLMGQYTT